MTTVNMCIIFFIFGITLETSELKEALKAVRSLTFGMISILLLTCLTGFIPLAIPFKPYEFSVGLAIMACVPTSLSSGVSLVIQSYGNGALALLFTVASNLIGIVTCPLMIKMVLAGKSDAHIDAADLLFKLSVSILMPLLVGKALREAFTPTQAFAKKYKIPLYMTNNLQIIIIVWQKLSNAQEALMEQEFVIILLAIAAAIVQHFCFLVMNTVLTWGLRVPHKERQAIIIMASQKNLPVAAVIISYFDPDVVGSLGLITLPCIVFYIMQLFIDATIANSWASKYEKGAALEEKYREQLKDIAAQEEQEEQHDQISSTLAAVPSKAIGFQQDDHHHEEEEHDRMALLSATVHYSS
jgi:sodium/bile acid cotransporter 7